MSEYVETMHRARVHRDESLKEQELHKLSAVAPALSSFKNAASAFKEVVNAMNMSFGPNESKIKGIYPQEDKKLIVVKWIDNTITKVQCSEEDTFDIYVGVALAYTYKMFGSNTQFRKIVNYLIGGKK